MAPPWILRSEVWRPRRRKILPGGTAFDPFWESWRQTSNLECNMGMRLVWQIRFPLVQKFMTSEPLATSRAFSGETWFGSLGFRIFRLKSEQQSVGSNRESETSSWLGVKEIGQHLIFLLVLLCLLHSNSIQEYLMALARYHLLELNWNQEVKIRATSFLADCKEEHSQS